MEGVGLAASLVTLVETTGATIRTIRDIRNAPDALSALSNEVADLKLVITDIQARESNDTSVHARSESLTKLMLHARIKLDEVEKFVQNLLSADTNLRDGNIAYRIKWALGKKKRAYELVQELREIRHNVVALLGLQAR